MHRVSLLALCALTGCAIAAEGPEPKLSFRSQDDVDGDALGELAVNVRITAAIEKHALRKPPLSKTVDAQIDAMLAYVREHGRGTLHAPSLTAAQKKATRPADEYQRLYSVGVQAMSLLSLSHGPAELSRVALEALVPLLGRDATLVPGHEPGPDAGNFVFAQRAGIAFLALRELDEAVSDRMLAVLEQWAAGEHPPRAVVIDLSRCENAAPDAAARLVAVLAPGRPAFTLEVRDEKSSALQRHAFGGSSDWASPAYASTPVFLVVSEHTASLAEAASHALRQQRMAHVIGTPTLGDGRLVAWYELPDHARFTFTIGDVLDAQGKPLRDQSLVPDACRHGAELVAIAPRTVEQARAVCDGSTPTQDEALEYARRVLDAEAPPVAAPSPGAPPAPPVKAPGPLQHGETET